jgi:hypothetical protein
MRTVRTVLLACLGAALLAGGAGCSCNKKPAEADPVIATVDGREIRASALVAEYEAVPAEHRARYTDHRGALLDFIINRMVIADEARAVGLDEDPAVIERIEQAREFATTTGIDEPERRDALLRDAEQRVLSAAMRERVLAELELTISDEELRAFAGEATGGDLPSEFIEVNGIVNADRAQVEAARAELAGGAAFRDVHAAYSTDENPHFGSFADTTIDNMPDALRAVVEGVENGGLTDVFEMDGRFAVARVTRRSAVVDLEPWRPHLLARKRDDSFRAWVNEKKADHRIAVNTERLDEVQLPNAPENP